MPRKSTKPHKPKAKTGEADWYASAEGRRQTQREFERALKAGRWFAPPDHAYHGRIPTFSMRCWNGLKRRPPAQCRFACASPISSVRRTLHPSGGPDTRPCSKKRYAMV